MGLFKKKHLSKRKKEKLREIKKEERRIKKEQRDTNKIIEFFKPFFGGLAVGIANIIPGVSGGTMLVIFDLFEKLTNSISDIFKKGSTSRKESIFFLLKVLIGTGIGIVVFAKLLGFMFEYIKVETTFWFMGLILFSVPIVIKTELKDKKFNIIFFIIGVLIIAGIEYLNVKGITGNLGNQTGIMEFVVLVILGLIGGATMIFPGISGSMILLILGKYEMIREYIDKVTSLDINIYIKLGVFGIGVLIGIVLTSKIVSFLLNKYRGQIISLIVGFVTASALVLPFNLDTKIVFSTENICWMIISFVLGGIVIYFLNKLENKKMDE